MSGNVILDVAIGLFFLYLILSLMCSALQEYIATIFKMRSINLEYAIWNLLDGKSEKEAEKAKKKAKKGKEFVTSDLFDHPLIKGLAKAGTKPSYIPSGTFALALMDTIGKKYSKGKPNNPGAVMAEAKKIVGGMDDDSYLQKTLLLLIEDAKGDMEKTRKNIEQWFDDKMDRAAGWYKRKVKLVMFGIALILAMGLNINSIHVAKTLWEDQGIRQMMVSQAQGFQDASPKDADYEKLSKQLEKMKLPIGWTGKNGLPGFEEISWHSIADGVTVLLGWLITAVCASLGAPFWFDALGKALSIRAAGNKPKRSTS